MCDKDLLVAYLYDELGDADRARMDAHLRGCAACQAELAGLRGTRAHLTAWAPPEPDLGFQVVRARSAARQEKAAGWRARLTPAFGLAAAATLVLAAAGAVANLQVHYGSDGFTVHTGWATQAAATGARTASTPLQAASSAAIDPATVQAIERRVADLEQLEKTAPSASAQPAPVVSAAVNRMSDAELRRFVRDTIAQSESREQTMLARQIQQVTIDFQRQRTTDMGRVLQMVNYVDSRTASDAAVHRQLAAMIQTVSQK